MNVLEKALTKFGLINKVLKIVVNLICAFSLNFLTFRETCFCVALFEIVSTNFESFSNLFSRTLFKKN